MARWILRIALCGLLASLFLFANCHGRENAPADVLSVQVTEEALKRAGAGRAWRRDEGAAPVGIIMGLPRVYGIAIHEERTALDAAGEPKYGPRRTDFDLAPGDSLETALDRLVEIWPEDVRWSRVCDKSVVVFMQPMDHEENLLDTRITVTVEDASTWDAIKAIGEAILETRPGARTLSIDTPGAANLRRPPRAMLEPGAIDKLSFVDAPAREALCTVLERAPIGLSYAYRHMDSASYPRHAYISLHEFARNDQEAEELRQEGRRMMDGHEEMHFWNAESRIGRE